MTAETIHSEDVSDLSDANSYLPPPLRSCDLVMKGGITSGIVYPTAICELAQEFRLRNIGGTSAGAIAAAAAAAAELGRASADGGFVQLAELASWLGRREQGTSNMLALFQPQAKTRKYFDLFMGQLRASSIPQRIGSLISIAARHFPIQTFVPLIGGLAIGLVPVLLGGGPWAIVGLTGWVLLGVVGTVVAVAWSASKGFVRDVAGNGYGLCRGSGHDRMPTQPQLTDWLSKELNRLAGFEEDAPPVTFGDLAAGGVRLQMMSTNLSFGTPVRLPFDERIYFYNPDQLSDYFPANVMRALNDASPAVEPDDPVGYSRFPEPEDTPIVVAVRMSLSFPVLLSAVPLWAFDYTTKNEAGEHPFKQVWFSDGGIASNFPLHFFDRPLPAAPTFAINLGTREELSPNQKENTYLPIHNLQGILPHRTDIDSLVGFLKAVLDTMQNWTDNGLTRIPGYRDRVVTLYHDSEEGGMNLEMDAETIGRLTERGQWAGWRLRTEFDFENHRWVRYRSIMELLQIFLAEYRDGFGATGPGVPTSFEDMITGDEPGSYRSDWSDALAEFARQRTYDGATSLTNISGEWEDKPLGTRAPNPTPTLRVTPDL